MNTSRSGLEEVNVAGLQPEKKYSLRVVAFNDHGAGSSSPLVEVETESEPHVLQAPSHFNVTAVSSDSIMAVWTPPKPAAGTPIRNYKLFYMETGSAEEHEILTTHNSHLIHALKPYTDYSVWVVAFNENGPGTSTEEVQVRTLSTVPSDTPRNVVAEPASSTVCIPFPSPPPPPPDPDNGGIFEGVDSGRSFLNLPVENVPCCKDLKFYCTFDTVVTRGF